MENENNELNQNVENNVEQTQATSTKINGIVEWVKSHTKVIAIAAVILVVAIVAVFAISNLTGGPEKAVKNYVSALNSGNAKKLIKSMDLKGTLAYIQCSGYWSSDLSKFEEKYAEIDEDDIEDREEDLEELLEEMQEDKKGFSMKVVEIKEVKEVEDCKDLYNVEAKIRVKYKDEEGDTQDTTNTMKFVVYKNKVVSSPIN